MKTKQSLPSYALNSGIASFNTISLDDEHAAAATAPLPPSTLATSSASHALPSAASAKSRFIENCYNHFFRNSAVRSSSSASLNNGGARSMLFASRQTSVDSTSTVGGGSALSSAAADTPPPDGRRRAKLVIAIDADEPYAGLAKLHNTPSTPFTAGAVISGVSAVPESVLRSRSTSMLSRAVLQRNERPLKAKESIKGIQEIIHAGEMKRKDFHAAEGSTSSKSPEAVSPTSPPTNASALVSATMPGRDRHMRLAHGSSVEYSPPATSHYSSAFSSNSGSANSSSAVSPTTTPAAPSADSGLSFSRGTSGDDASTAISKRAGSKRSMMRMLSYEAEDDFPYYDLESGIAIERRNHYQFAKVLESASSIAALNASTPIVGGQLRRGLRTPGGACADDEDTVTELAALRAAAASDADFRRRLCEYSLADEMREVLRKYNDTPDLDLRTPDRIFKVVFIGDSGVGKTCFLHRFCHNRFRPLFNATIGVDFIVKTIRIRDRLVAVQLWDTAGQERFRSITKQYFRKADGVVLMYDVTSEQSYLNVRNWIESVRVGVDDECVMCLIGNKVDLYPNEECRSITYKHGADLANEFDMIFFETSAYTGLGINDSMRALAFRLQQRENEHLAEAMRLEKGVARCSRSRYCYCL